MDKMSGPKFENWQKCLDQVEVGHTGWILRTAKVYREAMWYLPRQEGEVGIVT
jgi:hypothetical protein